MRDLHRWVSGSGNNICTKSKLWADLGSDEGILNSTAELVKIWRGGLHFGQWTSALEAKTRPIAKLGRVAEVFYDSNGDRTLTGTVYEYLGDHGTMNVFCKPFSRRLQVRETSFPDGDESASYDDESRCSGVVDETMGPGCTTAAEGRDPSAISGFKNDEKLVVRNCGCTSLVWRRKSSFAAGC